MCASRNIVLEQKDSLRYIEKRKATRILRGYFSATRNENDWTERGLEQLDVDVKWAVPLLPDFAMDYMPPGKRKHVKRKPCALWNGKTYAQIIRNRKIIGIVDKNSDYGRIPKEKWNYINAALADVMLSIIAKNPGTPPSCIDIGWYQGSVKLIGCDDNRTVELYKKAINQVGEVYRGAHLVVVDAQDILSRPLAKCSLPPLPGDTEGILEMMQNSNPQLPTHNWKIVDIKQLTTETIEVMVLLNKESVAPLEQCEGWIKYSFGQTRLKGNTENVDFIKTGISIDPPSDIEIEYGDINAAPDERHNLSSIAKNTERRRSRETDRRRSRETERRRSRETERRRSKETEYVDLGRTDRRNAAVPTNKQRR